MTTKGYDPYTTLARFFFEWPSFTPEEMRKVKSIVGGCLEERLHSPEVSLATRFVQCRGSTWGGGPTLRADDLDLIEGLLQCLHNRNWNWYTLPDAVQLRLGGIFDHFKGGVYKVRGFSSWAGNNEPVVEYTSMVFGTDHTRFVSEWCEVVKWPDGAYRSRFVYRGSDLTARAPSFKVPDPTGA